MILTLGTVMLLVLLCFVALSVTPDDTVPDRDEEYPDLNAVAGWLRRDALRFQSLTPDTVCSDLVPLKAALSGVRVIGMGEATHGSREFSLLKHRLLEFLVREMGFTVFIIEASYPACLSINDFVLHGKGDRAEALAGLGFWTCDTEEMSDLIDWMHAYNQVAPGAGKVQFLGIDLQMLVPGRVRIVQYLQRFSPDYASGTDALIGELLDDELTSRRSVEAWDGIKAGLYDLLDFLTLHQSRMREQSSEEEFFQIVQQVRVMIQFEDTARRPTWDADTPAASGAAMRDVYMAQNVRDILAYQDGGKAVVWAHNSHVSTAYWKGGTIPSLGQHLRNRFGQGYYALGLVFNEGAFQARNGAADDLEYMAVREFHLGPAPEGALEWYFAQARIGDFLIDLRSAPKDGVMGRWLETPHATQYTGALFWREWPHEKYLKPIVPATDYDGIAFVEHTTRAVPTPTGVRDPQGPSSP